MRRQVDAPTPPTKESALRRLSRIVVPEAADLVLLGDSNAAAWPSDLLDRALPGRRVFNFGLPGDRIGHTLWRLEAVPAGHLRPRDVVVILGTNNLADGDAPADVSAGLLRVIYRVQTLWGHPRIILPTVARRIAGPLARSVERVALNGLLLALDRPGLQVVRSDLLLDEAGPKAFEPDGIHISQMGYEVLTAALAELIAG